MLEQLRGRNLAHVGCTLGLTTGLALGLVAAVVIVNLVSASSATNLATAVWLGLTFALGIAGYWIGGNVSRRLWGRKPAETERE
jgi:putative Mn2+ efflux pump MntP